MSNLWFFRLKKQEQQRRRSSGEQSVGSASVQSATGSVSAASAPVCCSGEGECDDDDCTECLQLRELAANGGRASSDAGVGVSSSGAGQAGGGAATSRRFSSHYHGHHQHHHRRHHPHQLQQQRQLSFCDHDHDEQQQNDDQLGDQNDDNCDHNCPESERRVSAGSERVGREDDLEERSQERQEASSSINHRHHHQRHAHHHYHHHHPQHQNFRYESPASGFATEPPEVGTSGCLGGGGGGLTSRMDTYRGSAGGATATTMANIASNSKTGAVGPPRPRQVVPQVNIIRSDSTDSTSSKSILIEAAAAPDGPTEPEVESSGPSGAQNEQQSSVQMQQEQGQQQQQQPKQILVEIIGGVDGKSRNKRVESRAVDSSRAPPISSGCLRDQLISGQVPPIHDRRQQTQAAAAKLASMANQQQDYNSNLLLDPAATSGALGLGSMGMADSMDNLASLIPRVRVEFYNSENTLKEQLQLYFIKDHTVSLYVRTAKLILKVLACYLYVCRVISDRGPGQASCYGCQSAAATRPNVTADTLMAFGGGGGQNQQQAAASMSKFDSHPYDGPINFRALLWVDRGPIIWSMQTFIAVICFIEALLMQYLTYKNSIFSIISFHFTLELVTNLPFLVSAQIFWRELRTLFVPGFLNCWLAKQCLEAMLNDLSIVRQSSVFSHRLTILSATVFCLIFTSACGFQHTQRSGGRSNINIFESIYFVVVTFSTVGYGDFKPETWPSQLFIMVMICVALIVLPTQFEQLAYFWIERKKLGASYAHHSTRHEKHVVVCSTTLRADTIMDFLNEFYAHPLLQTFSVVLLSPCELDTTMKLVLQTPTWNNRVVYIQGSALKATDLIRARMQSAEACFILAARNYNDRSAADEHTILRSWAIRDFSPYVPQYVQIFRTENKIHVAFAEHVVCDDEFKYALLANNCLIPGTSTLVTLLLHTSQHKTRRRRRRRKRHRQPGGGILSWLRNSTGANEALNRKNRLEQFEASFNAGGQQAHNQENPNPEANGANNQSSSEDDDDLDSAGGPEWKRLYGKCSANEIYHIRLSDSRFFSEYQGKSFTYASFHSHRKFGVALIGVQTDMRGTWPIMLNPGPSYVLKSGDILFYINITKEENSTLRPMVHHHTQHLQHQQQQQQFSKLFTPTPVESTEPPSWVESGGGGGAGAASATYIRIEASSPTVGLQPQSQQQQQQPEPQIESPEVPLPEPMAEPASLVFEQQRQQQLASMQTSIHVPSMLMPKKHSVADGASIVARSLCSVAGFVAADFPVAPAEEPVERMAGSRAGSDAEQEQTLHHLTAKILAKRNSSASASGAVGATSRGSSALGNVASRPPSRNASTLELAALATGLRKGSNMSITSTKSRDASPTRLAQVVSGLAVKMKRVKLGKSLTHLTIPRLDMGMGGGSSASSTESFVNARGRRPSIAPVPAMMGESEEHDSDHEREQESYFSMSWQSSSESSPIVKKFVFCTTYVGVSPTLCYLLQKKKPACCLQLVAACEHCPFKNARQYNWPNNCIILASDFASNGIYNFLVPLRAHSHNPNELRPIVLLLERKPSPQFIDAISWFPMVYWMPGSIDSLDDLIKAGINLAHSVVVTNKESTNSAEEDYLADCNTIVAVQSMFKMFPSVGIITELSQSSNMRFMQFRAHDVLFAGHAMYQQQQSQQQLTQATGAGGSASGRIRESPSGVELAGLERSTSQQGDASSAIYGGAANNAIRDRILLRKLHSHHYSKMIGKEMNSHAYKYRLPFAAGNVFSASMLDTLLYQAFVKDYMITMVRLLLGIDQAPGSGFLSSMKITKEDLWIRTYGRLYQRLCSTTCEIPLGIYRTEPLDYQRPDFSGAFASQQASYEQATEELERIEITNMVKNRLQDLGMSLSDYDDSMANRANNTFSYVIINPNCDIPLREGDIIYLIRPSPIHSRKLFMHRANSVRHADDSIPPQAPYQPPPPPPPRPSSTQQQTVIAKNATGSGSQNSFNSSTTTVKSRSQRKQQQQQHQASQSQRRQTEQQPVDSNCQIKPSFSDGDFSEILIKVNNHDEHELDDSQAVGVLGPQVVNCCGDRRCDELPHCNEVELKRRRRSSCSDAEESRRSN